MKKLLLASAIFFAVNSVSAFADTWTNWTSADSNTDIVTGNADGVTVTANYDPSGFLQLNGTGTNYFTGFPNYTVPYGTNGPTSSDIIAVNNPIVETITFSSAVINPLIALASWNSNDIQFAPQYNAQLLSSGTGWWGYEGGSALNGSTPIDGSNGIIELQGTFTSISFNVPNVEYWHGFTVGFNSAAVPEPEEFAMMLLGLPLLGWAVRRKSA